ncbi:MAG: ubiquinone biosynthesis accessory factor UbiJ [Gammaproteobacteria bacterium]
MVHDALLAPVQTLLDKGVEQSVSAMNLCAELEGRTLLLRPGSTGLCTYFEVQEGRLLLKYGQPEQADAEIAGSVLSLLRLATDDPEEVIRSKVVTLSGDTEVAENYQALLKFIRPDPEEELSKVVGDPIAHEVGRVARGLMGWAEKARHSLASSVAEFLVEETRDLAAVTELAEFSAGVSQVSQGVDRAEARLNELREQIRGVKPA